MCGACVARNSGACKGISAQKRPKGWRALRMDPNVPTRCYRVTRHDGGTAAAGRRLVSLHHGACTPGHPGKRWDWALLHTNACESRSKPAEEVNGAAREGARTAPTDHHALPGLLYPASCP